MPHHTTRTIAYVCELFHPPLRPDPARIQKIHNALFENGRPLYTSFAVTPLAPVLTNPGARPEVVSQVAFLADRIQFREELGGLTSEGFAGRVREIAERAGEQCGIRAYIGQQVTVRSHVNPRHTSDSREFLRESMFHFGNELSVFERPPGVFGLRLAFPPGGGDATGHALRLESYVQDPRSLFIEVQSGYGGLPLPEGLGGIEANVTETYEFATRRALRFVEHFDRAAEE
jgi:hypothetical protein